MKNKEISFAEFAKNPDMFLSLLPNQAKREVENYLQFIFYKYGIANTIENRGQSQQEGLFETFETMRTGLPENFKFDRDEANER